MKRTIILSLTLLIFWACSENKIESYSSVRYLSFSKPEVADSVTFLSFTHYPGETEKTIALEVTLAGDLLTEELSYIISIVADSTTADPKHYSVDSEQIFKADQVKDTLYVKLYRNGMEDKEATLFLRIVSNQNFEPGFRGYTDARIVFNDIATQPLWWDSDIETLFLGNWSARKYEELIKSSGLTDLSNMEYSYIRKVSLEFKEYIRENGITEADGSAMKLPVF